MRTNCYHQ